MFTERILGSLFLVAESVIKLYNKRDMHKKHLQQPALPYSKKRGCVKMRTCNHNDIN